MSGIKGTNCPSCHGAGRIPGYMVGSSLEFIDPCPQCRGDRQIKLDRSPQKINPAHIHETSENEEGEEICLEIDKQVCRLSPKHKAVLMEEYTRPGRQDLK